MKTSKTLMLAVLVVASVLVVSSSAGWGNRIRFRFKRRRSAVVTTTTKAPTTESPTTKAPTTEAPTTEVPTTEAPATTTAPYVPAECDSLENNVCYQSCTAGGCTMECFNSEYYHSCDQSCTGKSLNEFDERKHATC